MVGFHTYDYARHFLSACRFVGKEGNERKRERKGGGESGNKKINGQYGQAALVAGKE